MTGRWCSLFVRGVRQGCFHYDEWKGTRGERLRERLILDDLEKDMLLTMFGGFDDPIKVAVTKMVLPWMGEATPDIPEMDYDEMYNSTIKAAANDPTIHG